MIDSPLKVWGGGKTAPQQGPSVYYVSESSHIFQLSLPHLVTPHHESRIQAPDPFQPCLKGTVFLCVLLSWPL